jgi:hypothetical protein
MTLVRLFSFMTLGLAACSTASNHGAAGDSGAPGADATLDVAEEPIPIEDTAVPDSAPLHFRDGSISPDDGGTMCDELEAMLNMFQATAQACSPTAGTQCTGEAMGVCCPITVNTGADQTDINNYEVAVMNYVMMCNPKCSLPNCPPLNSGQCVGAGTCQ